MDEPANFQVIRYSGNARIAEVEVSIDDNLVSVNGVRELLLLQHFDEVIHVHAASQFLTRAALAARRSRDSQTCARRAVQSTLGFRTASSLA